ncbi:MAG: hypothetical protein IK056_04910, partial [Clostridia bacterium]|nr:hypothetical protein [Clostridia bacterium]
AHSDNGNDKPLGHDWDDGVVTKEPTATTEGEMTYTCKRDPSHTKKEAIPPTGSDGKASLVVNFWAEDENGQQRTQFHMGEYFKLRGTVTNTGKVPIELYTYVIDLGGGGCVEDDGEYPHYVLGPGETVAEWDGMNFLDYDDYVRPEMLEDDTETATLMGTFECYAWVGGYEPKTLKHICDATSYLTIEVLKEGDILQPALKLSASWEADAGKDKCYEGAPVQFKFKTTNTGNCPVTVYSGDPIIIGVEGPSGTMSPPCEVELQPEESVEWTCQAEVTEEQQKAEKYQYTGHSTGYYTDAEGEIRAITSNDCQVQFPLTHWINDELKDKEYLLTLSAQAGEAHEYNITDYESNGGITLETVYADGTETIKNESSIPLDVELVFQDTPDKYHELVYYIHSGILDTLQPGEEKTYNEIIYGRIYEYNHWLSTLTSCFNYYYFITNLPQYRFYAKIGITAVGSSDDVYPDKTFTCESNFVVVEIALPRVSESRGSDYCSITLDSLGETEARYTLHECARHLKLAKDAEALALEGDWAGAARIWRADLEEFFDAAHLVLDEQAIEILNAEKEALFAYADAVRELYGDEAAANFLRLRSARICHILHTAPERLPSLFAGGWEKTETSDTYEASLREIGALEGSDCLITEYYAGAAAEALAGTKALSEAAADGAAAQALDIWKDALDVTANRAYKAADKDTRALIGSWRMALTMLYDADEELYELFWSGKPADAEELLMDLYKEAALLIDSIG